MKISRHSVKVVKFQDIQFTVKVSQNIKAEKPSPCISKRSIGFNYVILINSHSGPHICYV